MRITRQNKIIICLFICAFLVLHLFCIKTYTTIPFNSTQQPVDTPTTENALQGQLGLNVFAVNAEALIEYTVLTHTSIRKLRANNRLYSDSALFSLPLMLLIAYLSHKYKLFRHTRTQKLSQIIMYMHEKDGMK